MDISPMLTKREVLAIARALGLELTDPAAEEFIYAADSVYVQAVPGSGKTSLLSIKISALLSQWNDEKRGLCAMSHTNVAWKEIASRVGSISGFGARLRSHPHFVGTFQSFVTNFLAGPWIRAQGMAPRSIDDEIFAESAERLLAAPRFATLRQFLSRRNANVGTVSFAASGGDVSVDLEPFGLTLASKSGQQLAQLKNELAKRGLFRYQDMFASAHAYLESYPAAVGAARRRFPVVFIDECQDTNATQMDLILRLFDSSDVTIQWIGDANQGIFSSGVAERLSGLRQISMGTSRRFGPEIATFARSMMIDRVQEIAGHGQPGRLILIKYDESTVRSVVPTFEAIVAAEDPTGLRRAVVLGARWRPGSAKKYPQSLACYHPIPTADSVGQDSLFSQLASVRALWGEAGQFSEVRSQLVRIAWTYGVEKGMRRPADLANSVDALVLIGREDAVRIRVYPLLLNVLTRDLSTASDRLEVLVALGKVCVEVGFEEIPLAVDPHLSADEGADAPFSEEVRDDRTVVKTVHSAKGETHFAVLLVECLDSTGKQYDLAHVWAILSGEKSKGVLSPSARQAVKVVFVAATRASKILALASSADRVAAVEGTLRALGWELHDLTTGHSSRAG